MDKKVFHYWRRPGICWRSDRCFFIRPDRSQIRQKDRLRRQVFNDHDGRHRRRPDLRHEDESATFSFRNFVRRLWIFCHRVCFGFNWKSCIQSSLLVEPITYNCFRVGYSKRSIMVGNRKSHISPISSLLKRQLIKVWLPLTSKILFCLTFAWQK